MTSTSTPSETKKLGVWGEAYAADWLKHQGYQLIEQNWRAGRVGEVDLIVHSPEGYVVFVEVKTRRGKDAQLLALAAITSAKQQQLCQLAEAYVAQHPALKEATIRLDVVAIAVSGLQEPPLVVHLANAFGT